MREACRGRLEGGNLSPEQFDTWLEFHCAAYPSLRDWLATNGQATGEHWLHVMDDVDYHDARRATQLLFAGDEPNPEGWSNHPAAVRRISKRLAAERIADQGRKKRQLELETAAGDKVRPVKWTMGGAFHTIVHYLDEARALGLTFAEQKDYAHAKAWPDIDAGRYKLPQKVHQEKGPPAVAPSLDVTPERLEAVNASLAAVDEETY